MSLIPNPSWIQIRTKSRGSSGDCMELLLSMEFFAFKSVSKWRVVCKYLFVLRLRFHTYEYGPNGTVE